MTIVCVPGSPLQLSREIPCDTLQSEFKAPAKQASTVTLTCQSKDLLIEGRGTMAWKTPLADSQPNVLWQVRADETYKQERDLLAFWTRKRLDRSGTISFRLQGTLRHPRPA